MTAQDTGYHAGGDGQHESPPASGENASGNSANGSGYDPRLLLNSTQIPDVIIDRWMPTLSGGELRVVIYVARRTYGWRKPDDEISVSQLVNGITKRDGTRLDYGTGLSRSQVVSAVDSLCEKGVLIRRHNKRTDGGDAPSTYSLDLSYRAPEPAPKKRAKYGANGRRRGGYENHTPPGGYENRTRGGTVSGPPGVRKSDPQQSVNQHPVSTTDRIDLPSVDQSEARTNSEGKEQPHSKLTERPIDRSNKDELAQESDDRKPWRKLDEKLKSISTDDVGKQALSIAEEIRGRLGVPASEAVRLASHCVNTSSVDLLRAAVSATANSRYRHAWPTLLTAFINRISDDEVQARQGVAEGRETAIDNEAPQEQPEVGYGVEAPSPDLEAQELWNTVLAEISETANSPSLVVWFDGAVPVALEDHAITVALPNRDAVEYIEARFRKPIEEALKNELSLDAELVLINYG